MAEGQVRRRVVVHGNVQGVFFRDSTEEEASSAGVGGWVRNRDDGTVEAHFEGDRAAVEAEFVGTHVGEFAGLAPTGRLVRVPYAVAYDLAGETIAALRLYLPLDALVRQIRDA